ncbi:MAG: hypothetical protein NW224_19550 [Leptolyngbyaceae cyanobacterium bins.302]|nr:hypothetical protein [Leptolyngbyaceae cyanobacterium bins.302]
MIFVQANRRSPVQESRGFIRTTIGRAVDGTLRVSSFGRSRMGSQSTAKTIFLLASMVGWLMVGAALMYLFPFLADRLLSSELTHQWMKTLSRSGYNPMLAWVGGGFALAITTIASLIWNRHFEGKL